MKYAQDTLKIIVNRGRSCRKFFTPPGHFIDQRLAWLLRFAAPAQVGMRAWRSWSRVAGRVSLFDHIR
jgi:hypothetical protein